MSQIFGFSQEQLQELGAFYTATEIHQQPQLWQVCVEMLQANHSKFSPFINKVLSIPNLQIVFTGAGTSAYVGDTIYSYIENLTHKPTFSLATTDVVSNPKELIKKGTPTLLVSFARSGNSPESVATYDLFMENCDQVYNLVITCNNEGALAKKTLGNDKNLVVLMPDASNDKSFAMTSSFTCMMLSALLLFQINELDAIVPTVQALIKEASCILDENFEAIKNITTLDYDRIVYLGSGALKGLCKEMSLKNLELTSGRYITTYESTLGFRHGPKSIVNNSTLVIFLCSNDSHTALYDYDLVKEVYNDCGEHKVIVLSYTDQEVLKPLSDYYFTASQTPIDDAFSSFYYILFGQIFALFNSLKLNISPDNPRPDGTVNRVVQGVTIHPFNA